MPDILNTVAQLNTWQNKINQALAPLKVTFPQAQLLLLVDRHKSLTCGEVADALHVSRGNITGIAERIRHAGLIGTSRGEPDRRKVHLSLTNDGADLIPQIKDILAKVEAPAA